MSGKTTFAGFEWLAPGEALSADGYWFQFRNPQIADRLGRIGAVSHKHDAHAAMVDPTTAVIGSTNPTGGVLASNLAIYLTYTLNDPDGGETLPVAPLLVTTPAGFATPNAAPTAAVDYTAGGLLAGTFGYMLSVTDGVGGETIVGPAVTVTVDPGHATAQINLSGLAAILAAASGGAGGAAWRLWRVQGGSPLYLIGTGTGNTFTDNGVAGDCTVAPPPQNTTKGTNELLVTVPGTSQPAAAVTFNIFASLDATFTNPCRLGTYPVSDFGVPKTFTNLTMLQGAPPAVSSCFPGANKVDPDTDILNWTWKRPVADHTALLALGGMSNGDTRITLDTNLVWTYNLGLTAWLRSPVRFPVANFAALPTIDLRDGDFCATLDTHRVWIYDAGATGWRLLGASQREAKLTAITGLVAATETAETLDMPSPSMTVYAVTVDAACRVRIYPTAALATADIARAASADPDVAAQNGCYYEHTFTGAGTHILTPAVAAIMQEGTLANHIAANVSSPAGGNVNVTLFGFRLE